MDGKMSHDQLQPGDVVVGSFTEEGRQLSSGGYAGDKNYAQRLQNKIIKDMLAVDGAEIFDPEAIRKPGKKIVPKKTKAGRKVASRIEPEPLTPLITQRELDDEVVEKIPKQTLDFSPKKYPVALSNGLGKIKMQVIDVLDSTMAFCLVFACEDDMIFTPKAGETLTFTDGDGEQSQVYYADTTFNWMDGEKYLMILFKNEND